VSNLEYGKPTNDGNENQILVRQAIDEAISSLGGPIHKTINWHMNNRGVFADPKRINIKIFYDNLKELLGPGADMIMEETWEHLTKQHGVRLDRDFERKHSPVERIQKIIEVGGE
jgi:hypothetical protein